MTRNGDENVNATGQIDDVRTYPGQPSPKFRLHDAEHRLALRTVRGARIYSARLIGMSWTGSPVSRLLLPSAALISASPSPPERMSATVPSACMLCRSFLDRDVRA